MKIENSRVHPRLPADRAYSDAGSPRTPHGDAPIALPQ